MRALIKITLLLGAFLFLESTDGSAGSRPDAVPGSWLRNIRIEYEENGIARHGSTHIYFPKGHRSGIAARTLILLHGYRQSPDDWERRTPVARYADEHGFVLVCPAMTTTLYESSYFPETVNRWSPVPGGRYVMDILIPFLKKEYGLAAKRERTGIFGVSTGARGAVLLAARHNDVFAAAAGLSGDYDASSMRRDRILTSVYGRYEDHRERWEAEVNIVALAERLRKTPVFLGHGTRDGVVPPQQTELLFRRLAGLRGSGRGYECVVEREKSERAGHDWDYWGGLAPEVFVFFDRRLRR